MCSCCVYDNIDQYMIESPSENKWLGLELTITGVVITAASFPVQSYTWGTTIGRGGAITYTCSVSPTTETGDWASAIHVPTSPCTVNCKQGLICKVTIMFCITLQYRHYKYMIDEV